MKERHRYNTQYRVATKTCGECGDKFATSYKWTHYCSQRCSEAGAAKAAARKVLYEKRRKPRKRIVTPERAAQIRAAKKRYQEKIERNPALKCELLRRQRIRDRERTGTAKRREQVRLATKRYRERKKE